MGKILRRLGWTLLIYLAMVLLVAGLATLYFSIRDRLGERGPQVDSQSAARAWLDADADGIWDPEEQPFQEACIWSDLVPSAFDQAPSECSRSQSHPGPDGMWPGVFYAGGGDTLYIFAEPPAGHVSTTQPAVKAPFAEFGFAPAGLVPGRAIGSRYSYVQEDMRRLALADLLGRIAFFVAAAVLLLGAALLAWRLDNALLRRGFA